MSGTARRLRHRSKGGSTLTRCSATLVVAGTLALTSCGAPLERLQPDSSLAEGRGHLAAERYAEARVEFASWLDEHPDDDRARVGIAAAWEGLAELDSARAAYADLLDRDIPRSVRRQLEGRLRLIDRAMLRRAAQSALARETALAQTPPTPNAVAVFPFRYVGTNAAREPLERALAFLMIADLAKIQSLVLLERGRIQVLIDEMQMTDRGRVDSVTAARFGRLLQSEHVLQGTITDFGRDRIAVQGSAVRTTTGGIAAAARAEDDLDRIIDLEKELLFQLLDRMGVPITPLERERIAERPTTSLQAFLSFGRGLGLEDAGDYAGAVAEYQDAISLDPGFVAALGQAEAAGSMAVASQTSLMRVVTLLDAGSSDLAFVTEFLNAVMGSSMSVGDRIQVPHGDRPPGNRDGAGEVGGRDRLGGFADVIVTVKRP